MSIVISGNKNLKFIKAVYYQPVIPPPNPYEKYLTIEPLEDDFQIEFYNECNALYSLNGSDWTPFEDDYMSPVMNVGDKLYVKGELEPGYGAGQFYTEQLFNLSGNCNSLIFGDNAHMHDDLTGYNDCYNYLFSSCMGLKNASKDFLPATTLDDNCYASMFADCTSLTQAPELPATTLVENCYRSMFSGCSSLVTAPTLPATELVEGCYKSMFTGCSKLNYIKALFTTTPSSSYTYNWVSRVSSTGTFIKNKNATWNVTGVHGIPSGWTVQTV